VADGPEALTIFAFLFDPSLRTLRINSNTICQNLPETAVTPAEAEEGQ